MALTLGISITENSYSAGTNTSNCTVKVTQYWTYGTFDHNGYTKTCTIDDTAYDFSSAKVNPSKTTSGSAVIFEKTLTIQHNSNGAKTLNVSVSVKTATSSGTVMATGTKVLTTIPRKSSLTVANGTLGTAQTLTISEQATSFYHILKYSCGNVSGYVFHDGAYRPTATLSGSWTPPLSLAAQNTTGTSVLITFTLETYSDATTLIGTSTYTKTFAIPASVKPTASIAVSDLAGYHSTYSKYVQGKSKVKIVVTASGSQGSTIVSRVTTVDGNIYNKATVETDVIKGSGTLKIATTVTDSRGRTATATQNITVLAYTPPTISAMEVIRCNSDGTANDSGSYLKVIFSAQITALDSKNTAAYAVAYKKASTTSYGTAANVTSYGTGTKYNVINGTYVFAADTGSSYDVKLTAKDAFVSIPRVVAGPSTSKLFSILASKKGWAFGKVAELADYLDVNFKAKFRKAVEMDSTLKVASPNPADIIGFQPIQQGGGTSQLGSKVYIGWTGSKLNCQVDVTNFGPIAFESYVNNYRKPSCTYSIGTNLALTANEITKLPLTAYVINTNGAFSLSSDGGIVLPFGGNILASGGVYMITSTSATVRNGCFVEVWRNGAVKYSMGNYSPDAGNVSAGMKILPVNAGDIVYLFARGYGAEGTAYKHAGTYVSLVYI